MFIRSLTRFAMVACMGLLAFGLARVPAAAQTPEADKAAQVVESAKAEAAQIVEAAKLQAAKILAASAGFTPAPAKKPDPDFPLTKGPYRGATIGDFLILVPITPKQAEKGLKFVKEIPLNRGMVFFQKSKSPALVTTGDCPAMDLVFIAPDGTIQVILAVPAAKAGLKDEELPRCTLKGISTKAEAEKLAPSLAHTAFVVQVGAGEGTRFAKSWKAEMTERFLKADPNHRVWGF